MEKMKMIIADDDFSSRYVLSQFTQLLPEYEVVGEVGNGEELIEMVMIEKPDLVLADINMPKINGVEAVKTLKEINPSLQVVFTTGYDDFAVEAFNISAIDYIVKPVERVRLFVALEKAKKAIQFLKMLEAPSVKNSSNKLSIKSNNNFIYLSFEDILFIEKVGRKSIIHTINERFETAESLQELEERLPDYFFKSHRSFLVNLKEIDKITAFGESYLAYFSSDKVASISKLKINEIHTLLGT